MQIVTYHKQLRYAFGALLFFIALQAVLLFGLTTADWLKPATALCIVALSIFVGYTYAKEKKAVTALLNQPKPSQQENITIPYPWIKQLVATLHAHQQQVTGASNLIKQIARGETITVAAAQEDELSREIVHLQEQLTTYRTQEKKRAWATEGLARFSELLRVKHNSLQDFSFATISEIVKYIGASQGALFLKGQDEFTKEEYLELSGAYAYERRKHINKKVLQGEGLLGQCMLEKDTLYLTDIPQDYISIKSGLGTALPRNVLMIPMMTNDSFLGVIEVASFQLIEEYQVQFLQELAKSIAATLSVVQGSAHTQALLDESRHLAEDLKSSEEEMRQNMEELTATQEEISRKQLELDAVVAAIDKSMLKAEFTVSGKCLSANQHLLEIMGWPEGIFHEKSHTDLVNNSSLHQAIWSELMEGHSLNKEYKTRNRLQQSCWLSVTYSPVYESGGRLAKIILIGQDITSRVQKEQEHERLSLVADNTDNSVIITNAEGCIEYVNPGFTKMSGYSLAEIIGKKPGSFLQGPETNQATIERLKIKLQRQEPVYDEILNYHKNGQTYWISLAINPVRDETGTVTKFISIQANITDTKETALDARYKLEAIGRSNAVLEMDTNGIILDANQNFLDIVHYSKEEIVGKHHRILVRKEEHDSAGYQQLWEQLKAGQHVNNEYVRITKEGRPITLRGIYNPILDINGKPHKIVKFAIDITEEKRLQHEIREQETELNHYMESINNTIASLTFDKTGTIIHANDIYLSITGFTLQDITGKSYFDLLPESERNKPQVQIMWDSLQEGRFFSGEFKQIDKNGHVIWSTGTINPIYDSDKQVKKVILLAQFTTKEKEKAQELTSTITALKGIIPLLELNPDFSPKSANALFMEATGYTRMSLKNLEFTKCVQMPADLSLLQLKHRLMQEEMVDTQLEFTGTQSGAFSSRVVFAPVFTINQQLDKILLLFTTMAREDEKKANKTAS